MLIICAHLNRKIKLAI